MKILSRDETINAELTEVDSDVIINSIGWITMGHLSDSDILYRFGIPVDDVYSLWKKITPGEIQLEESQLWFLKKLLKYILDDPKLTWRFNTLIGYSQKEVGEMVQYLERTSQNGTLF